MATPNVLKVIVSELLTVRPRKRSPEPHLVMDDPAQVRAFMEAGSERGSLAPLYLFNTAVAAPLIRPGDLVVDLACGPANQLAQFAEVNSEARFIGVDLSAEMLNRARDLVARQGLSNVDFALSDITRLSGFEDRSVDVVISTLSLHHLGDAQALIQAFRETARILKPGGRVYFSDLGRLRSERAVAEFAQQYSEQQPEVFNLDYLNSLRAAFRLGDFRTAIRLLGPRVRLFSTFLVPYLIVVKSTDSLLLDRVRAERITRIERTLSANQKADLKLLRLFFRLGGLKC